MSETKPIAVEVLAYAPFLFFHCMHCELVWQQAGLGARVRREQLQCSTPEKLKQQYQGVSDWVHQMMAAHEGRIRFRVVDAASIEGWYKSLRYRVRKYPAVIVEGKEMVMGSDLARATQWIEQRLAATG